MVLSKTLISVPPLTIVCTFMSKWKFVRLRKKRSSFGSKDSFAPIHILQTQWKPQRVTRTHLLTRYDSGGHENWSHCVHWHLCSATRGKPVIPHLPLSPRRAQEKEPAEGPATSPFPRHTPLLTSLGPGVTSGTPGEALLPRRCCAGQSCC